MNEMRLNMNSSIIFITKDALRCGALPVYGNSYWKTPNIDELAAKGTVFKRHYTAGASTAMAFTSMALGKYCYETDRKLYDGNESSYNGDTLFDLLYDKGYDVHIAWDVSYRDFAKTHFKCEGKNTKVHSLNSIIPHHEPHITGEFDDLTFKNEETEKAIALVEDLAIELSQIKDKPVFLWFHLPHVFSGRNAYDSDIDIFDRIIGIFRKRFEDECIYVGADHGQMHGHKGKFGYGYDVEESAINIPLITPKFMGLDRVEFVTSSTQMDEIFGLNEFKQREYAICETAYYVQPCRRVAIIHNNFKLVYDKQFKKYFLYDLRWDKAEELNLYYPEFYDIDRHMWYSLNQRFFYPYWEEAFKEKELLTVEMNKIWKNGTFFQELKQKIRRSLVIIISRATQKKKRKKIINIGK